MTKLVTLIVHMAGDTTGNHDFTVAKGTWGQQLKNNQRHEGESGHQRSKSEERMIQVGWRREPKTMERAVLATMRSEAEEEEAEPSKAVEETDGQ